MSFRSTAWRRVALATLLPFAVARAGTARELHHVHAHLSANVDLTGTVTDTTTGNPLQAAEIAVTRAAGGLASNTITDAFGHFTIHNLAPGSYTVSVHLLGFRPVTRPLTVNAAATAASTMNFAMTPIGLSLSAVEVIARAPIAVDTRTGNQVFKQNDYHGAPTQTTSQILQQSIAGAARAPTGEVHIRGQHAEYTYYVDGVPVPSGISGSLNELFDPQVVNQIDFQTGGWDAEYGGRTRRSSTSPRGFPPADFTAAWARMPDRTTARPRSGPRATTASRCQRARTAVSGGSSPPARGKSPTCVWSRSRSTPASRRAQLPQRRQGPVRLRQNPVRPLRERVFSSR